MDNNYYNKQLTKLILFLLHTEDNEIWKEIPQTDGKYFISNRGKVLSLCGKSAIIRKNWLNNGYYYIDLWQNGKKKNYRINRLVANAFLPLPKDKSKCIAHHKDHNKLNNNLYNIKWVSHQENIQEYYKHKKEQQKNACAELEDNNSI